MATYVAEGRGGRARCGAHRRLSEVLRYGQPIWSLLVSGAQKHYSARLSTVRAEESERASEREYLWAFWGVDNSERRVPIKGESTGPERPSQNLAPALRAERRAVCTLHTRGGPAGKRAP